MEDETVYDRVSTKNRAMRLLCLNHVSNSFLDNLDVSLTGFHPV